jgi:hypothetical protein
MIIGATSPHYLLVCRNLHNIPIPRPTPLGIDTSLQGRAKVEKKAIVACPACGLVSVYSESNIQMVLSPTPDPFEAGICRLIFVEVECDDRNCESPKAVHTTIGTDRGTWKEKAAPRTWNFDSGCLCDEGHHLAPTRDDNHFAWEQRRSLF